RHELSSAKDARDELRQKLGTTAEAIDRLAAAQEQQAQTAAALRNDALGRKGDEPPPKAFHDTADASSRKEADARNEARALAQRTEREAKALAERAGTDPEKVRDLGSAARALKQIADSPISDAVEDLNAATQKTNPAQQADA